MNVTVHSAAGTPSLTYKVEHGQNMVLAFGRPDGHERSWSLLDDPNSLVMRLYPHLEALRPRVDVMHVDLQDTPNGQGFYATSSVGLLMVPVRNGWVLLNPSGELRGGQRVGGAVPSVRAWGRPPVNLPVAGGEYSLREHQLAAAWLPSNLGKMHRIDFQRDGSRADATFAASSGLTGRPDYRLSERNKRALVFFFEEYLRWGSDPIFNPQPTGTARERIRRLEAAGHTVPVASWLRGLWSATNKDQGVGPTAPRIERDSEGKPVGRRSDASEDRIWYLPASADKVAQLRSLELALEWNLITKPEVDDILASFDAADATFTQVVDDLTSGFEHRFRSQIRRDRYAASGGEAQVEIDRLVNKLGGMIRHALTHRTLNPTQSAKDLPDLGGMTVRQLHDRLHFASGSSPMQYQDPLDRAERQLEPEELDEWGHITLSPLSP
ncbi:hypothetical protein [Humibacillus xanthopallidus]|uniref:hypothetical protein n=1 Tax=Humibacillus xanthopallidus TaxID=412689 RepID=UPI001150134E|nr:hypothetical protein [Humibacillus xanthopallidus]